MHDVAFVIPVYNEGSVIEGVIREIRQFCPNVVCVNDGSSDNSAALIISSGAYLVDHPVNMGQGAALQTGLEFARMIPDVEYYVTFDADGQHRLADALHMLEVLKEGNVDIVLGSRFKGGTVGASRLKRAILKLAVRFTNATTGIKLTDAHNGLRAFNRHVAETLEITAPDMTHASEIIELISRNKYRYTEVPVTIEYTDYSKSKGQPVLNAVNIAVDTMLRRMSRP